MTLYKTYSSYKSIAVILSNSVSDFRMTLAARGLERAGYNVDVMNMVEYWRINAHDLFIISRPGDDMLTFIETCLQAGRPVVIDMDDDFYSIPPDSPAYQYSGAGAKNGAYLKHLRKVIDNPRVLVSYASQELGNRYDRYGFLAPNPWDDENPRWAVSNKVDNGKLVIGWAGTTTHRRDFDLVLPALKQILDEFPHVRVLIGGDYDIYKLFKDYPEDRRIYFPAVPYEVYPVIVKRCDVWLAPLQDTNFNRAKSDIKVVDAWAGRVPWVASALPQYAQHLTGNPTGLIVKDGGWYEALKFMVTNAEARADFSMFAEERRSVRAGVLYGDMWVEAVKGVVG